MPDKIETREALVEKLEEWGYKYGTQKGAMNGWGLLDALDAAGVVSCPKEPTLRQVQELMWGGTDDLDDGLRSALRRAIARSPFAPERKP